MLQALLQNLKEISEQNSDLQLRLVIADYASTDLGNIQLFVSKFQLQFPCVLINLTGTFSKVTAIEKMVRHPEVGTDEIVFICDVDLKLPTNVFHKIRSAVRPGRQFYAPAIAFEKETGEIHFPWYDTRGTGFISLFKSDYLKLNGFVGSIYEGKTTWGNEDEYLYASLQSRLGMKVYRVFEPSIISRWHKRDAGSWYGDRKASRWD